MFKDLVKKNSNILLLAMFTMVTHNKSCVYATSNNRHTNLLGAESQIQGTDGRAINIMGSAIISLLDNEFYDDYYPIFSVFHNDTRNTTNFALTDNYAIIFENNDSNREVIFELRNSIVNHNYNNNITSSITFIRNPSILYLGTNRIEVNRISIAPSRTTFVVAVNNEGSLIGGINGIGRDPRLFIVRGNELIIRIDENSYPNIRRDRRYTVMSNINVSDEVMNNNSIMFDNGGNFGFAGHFAGNSFVISYSEAEEREERARREAEEREERYEIARRGARREAAEREERARREAEEREERARREAEEREERAMLEAEERIRRNDVERLMAERLGEQVERRIMRMGEEEYHTTERQPNFLGHLDQETRDFWMFSIRVFNNIRNNLDEYTCTIIGAMSELIREENNEAAERERREAAEREEREERVRREMRREIMMSRDIISPNEYEMARGVFGNNTDFTNRIGPVLLVPSQQLYYYDLNEEIENFSEYGGRYSQYFVNENIDSPTSNLYVSSSDDYTTEEEEEDGIETQTTSIYDSNNDSAYHNYFMDISGNSY